MVSLLRVATGQAPSIRVPRAPLTQRGRHSPRSHLAREHQTRLPLQMQNAYLLGGATRRRDQSVTTRKTSLSEVAPLCKWRVASVANAGHPAAVADTSSAVSGTRA